MVWQDGAAKLGRTDGLLGDQASPLALALGFGDAGQELAAAAGAERAMDGFDVFVHRVRGDVQTALEFTRNIYRGSARAYSGDPAALALALDTIDTGAHHAYSLEERLFVLMPLVHAENIAMLSRAVLLADEMTNDAPPELRESWAFGAQRVRKYHALIARFGRYPGRNAALGRSSSAAELAHLAEEAGQGSPLAALAARA